MSVFELRAPSPSQRRTPLLVEVPHAGLLIPEEIADEYVAPRDAIMRDADIYVDELYANAPALGATLLRACVSRYVVDLNRDQGDVDAATVPDHPHPVTLQPRGVVWRATTDGRPILKRPLAYQQLRARLARFYEPYHTALRQQLSSMHAQFGYALVLAAHSMPSTGRSLHPDSGARRADVVPGTLGRTSADARMIDLVDAHFREAGLSVRHDDPYRGGYTTLHYGRPQERQHVVQVELNRALYVDETTFERRTANWETLRAVLDALVEKLGALSIH